MRQHIFQPNQKKLAPGALNDISRSTHGARKALTFCGGGSIQTPIGTIHRRRKPRRSSGGEAFPWEKLAFGYSLSFNAETAETTCTIYPGTVHLHGIDDLELDESDSQVLTGTPVQVYLQYPRNAGPVTVEQSNPDPVSGNYPKSNSQTVKIPLFVFTGTEVTPEEGSSYFRYTLARICNMGDVNFDTPIK